MQTLKQMLNRSLAGSGLLFLAVAVASPSPARAQRPTGSTNRAGNAVAELTGAQSTGENSARATRFTDGDTPMVKLVAFFKESTTLQALGLGGPIDIWQGGPGGPGGLGGRPKGGRTWRPRGGSGGFRQGGPGGPGSPGGFGPGGPPRGPGGFGPGGPGGPGGFGQGGPGGRGGRPGPPQPGQIMPSFLQDQLRLSAPQKQQLAQLQKEVNDRLDKILTADQKKQLKALRNRGPGGFGPRMPGGPPHGPGQGGPGGPGGPPPR